MKDRDALILVVILAAVVSWLGPGLVMDALSYTPPGVQPPKGLEKNLDEVVSKIRQKPCKREGQLTVHATANNVFVFCEEEE